MSSNECKYSWFTGWVAATLLWTALSAQASISVSQSIDRTDMAFDDTAGFQIVITWDGPAHAYRFDKPFRVQSDRLKVARFSSTVKTAGEGPDEVTTKVFSYRLAPVLSGLATVDPLEIEYLSWPDSLSGRLVTDPVTLSIAEPLPPEARENGRLSVGWYALIGVVLIGGAVGAFAALKKKPTPEKVRTPTEAFLEALAAIKTDAGNDLKKFQTGLYRELVIYIESKYNLTLAGKSVDGVVAEVEQIDTGRSDKDKLSEWLSRADREKFSPVAAAPGEVMRLESEIREFFEKLT
jgi:hypothetical protein